MDGQRCEPNAYGRSRLAIAIAASDLISTPFFSSGLALRGILQIEDATSAESEVQWSRPRQSFELALSLQDKIPLSSSFYRGITGIGWAIQLLPEKQQIDTTREMLTELDELLADGIECTSHPNLDLVNGITGIMVYAMRRGLNAPSSCNLWLAIEAACSIALSGWLRAEEAHQENKRKEDFLRNLGIAHGIPGLLMMVAIACRRGYISQALVAPLMGGFDRLWSFALYRENGVALFPTKIGETKPARLAWCYGALGLAEAFKVASVLDNRNAERFRKTIQGALYQFEEGKHGMRDASLCHGYSGAGFYFNEFSKSDLLDYEQRESCFKSAQAAYDATICMNSGSPEAARFTWRNADNDIESFSFLEGTSGVVLALKHIEDGAEKSIPWAEALGFYSP